MTIGHAFRKLTRLVRRLERSDWTVAAVEPVPGPAFGPGKPLVAAIQCSRGSDTSSGGAGTLPGRNGTQGAHPAIVSEVRDLSSDVAVSPSEVRVEPDGTTILDLNVEVRLDDTDPSENGTSAPIENGNGELPLHRDRNRLWRLYEEHDTFGDMATAVDRSVSEETIRRYMIEHGIHDPNADTNGHGRRTNGHGTSIEENGEAALPPSVDHEALVEAIVASKTVREVSNRLDLDRETTISILSELDLLDHVMGPLREASRRSITEAEIRDRIATVDPSAI